MRGQRRPHALPLPRQRRQERGRGGRVGKGRIGVVLVGAVKNETVKNILERVN